MQTCVILSATATQVLSRSTCLQAMSSQALFTSATWLSRRASRSPLWAVANPCECWPQLMWGSHAVGALAQGQQPLLALHRLPHCSISDGGKLTAVWCLLLLLWMGPKAMSVTATTLSCSQLTGGMLSTACRDSVLSCRV